MKYQLKKCENSNTIIYLFDNEMSMEANCNLVSIKVDDWLNDLSLWKTDKYQGNANKTLKSLLDIVNQAEEGLTIENRYICGYSLGGLFSLYAYLESDLFDGCASVSGSLWYPDFDHYIQSKEIRNGKIYLSLGDTEENTDFKEMRCVGDRTRWLYCYLKEKIEKCTYEVNRGGHFDEVEQRIQKGILWLLQEDNNESK